jgi:FMN phosphatase YigB (HAD superfamily)
MYIKMEDKRAAYIDIDETLIHYSPGGTLLLQSDNDGCYNVHPIEEHIELIKELRAVGWQIVIWSFGGADHAERVVKLLQIEHLVDLIVSKPVVYVDDLPFDQQGIRRIDKIAHKRKNIT